MLFGFNIFNVCIYVHIYIYMHLKSSFPKCDKRQFKYRGCMANAKFGNHVFAKTSSCMCIYIYIYIYMNNSFPKHNWNQHCKPICWNGTFSCFGKELFIYLCIYDICIYVYLWMCICLFIFRHVIYVQVYIYISIHTYITCRLYTSI